MLYRIELIRIINPPTGPLRPYVTEAAGRRVGFLSRPDPGPDPQKGVKSLYIKDRLFHFLTHSSTGVGGIGGKK